MKKTIQNFQEELQKEDRTQLIKNELDLTNKSDAPLIVDISRALSVPERLKIIELLSQKSLTIAELSKELDCPLTSTSFHVNALEKAKIIYTEKFTTAKGSSRICYLNCFNVSINFFQPQLRSSEHYVFDMPIGHYTSINPGDLCGLGCADYIMEPTNDPTIFFRKDRINAQIVWMNYGNISYKFPNIFKKNFKEITDLKFSFEICSEAPNYRTDFPSDITVWINDVEVLTFTSPGDFGERKGIFNPEWWSNVATQYGLLKNISVRGYGSFLDEKLFNSEVYLDKLNLSEHDYIKLTIGIKENAQFVGGFNLFGEKFGDFPQNIKMEVFTSQKSK